MAAEVVYREIIPFVKSPDVARVVQSYDTFTPELLQDILEFHSRKKYLYLVLVIAVILKVITLASLVNHWGGEANRMAVIITDVFLLLSLTLLTIWIAKILRWRNLHTGRGIAAAAWIFASAAGILSLSYGPSW